MTSENPTDPSTLRVSSPSGAALLAERRRRASLRVVLDDVGAANDGPSDCAQAPLFEATTSSIGGDVDAAGTRLVVWPDRVELRDRADRARAVIEVAAIDRVEVRRRLTSATLAVTGAGGESLVLKGVKPTSAARFRDIVGGLKLPVRSASTTPTSEALRRLDELAALGLLTDEELADERSSLARRPGSRRD